MALYRTSYSHIIPQLQGLCCVKAFDYNVVNLDPQSPLGVAAVFYMYQRVLTSKDPHATAIDVNEPDVIVSLLHRARHDRTAWLDCWRNLWAAALIKNGPAAIFLASYRSITDVELRERVRPSGISMNAVSPILLAVRLGHVELVQLLETVLGKESIIDVVAANGTIYAFPTSNGNNYSYESSRGTDNNIGMIAAVLSQSYSMMSYLIDDLNQHVTPNLFVLVTSHNLLDSMEYLCTRVAGGDGGDDKYTITIRWLTQRVPGADRYLLCQALSSSSYDIARVLLDKMHVDIAFVSRPFKLSQNNRQVPDTPLLSACRSAHGIGGDDDAYCQMAIEIAERTKALIGDRVEPNTAPQHDNTGVHVNERDDGDDDMGDDDVDGDDGMGDGDDAVPRITWKHYLDICDYIGNALGHACDGGCMTLIEYLVCQLGMNLNDNLNNNDPLHPVKMSHTPLHVAYSDRAAKRLNEADYVRLKELGGDLTDTRNSSIMDTIIVMSQKQKSKMLDIYFKLGGAVTSSVNNRLMNSLSRVTREGPVADQDLGYARAVRNLSLDFYGVTSPPPVVMATSGRRRRRLNAVGPFAGLQGEDAHVTIRRGALY